MGCTTDFVTVGYRQGIEVKAKASSSIRRHRVQQEGSDCQLGVQQLKSWSQRKSPASKRRQAPKSVKQQPKSPTRGLLPELPGSRGSTPRTPSPRLSPRRADASSVKLPAITQSTSPGRSPFAKAVSVERKRKTTVRETIAAAITLQRAVRVWLRRMEEVRLGLRPPLKPLKPPKPTPTKQKGRARGPVQYAPKPRKIKDTGPTKSSGRGQGGSRGRVSSRNGGAKKRDAAQALRRPSTRIGMPRDLKAFSRLADPSNMEHQVAALTIQLAWRQYARRLSVKRNPPKVRKLFEWSPEVRSVVRQEQQARVYAKKLAPVPQWKPSLKRVSRPSHLELLPSPAITSFNFAVDAYFAPMEDVRSKLARWEKENSEMRQLKTKERTMREEIEWMRQVHQLSRRQLMEWLG